jgi:diguanylate cyclase (GGDEF)-like protein/PAS domain S-box-containing protein
VVLLDGGLRVSWGSPALDRVLGEPAAARALAGQRLGDVVHPDDAAAVEAALLGTPAEMPGLDDVLLVLRLRHADGTWRRLEAGVSDLRTDPAVRAVVLHCRDITERYEREETLRSVAYTDPMTGMPNRAGLVHAVDAVLAEDRPATGAAVLLIEIDGLLEAREDTSWESVSRVIEEVGRRLRATVREDDVVARLGVGVFAALAREEGTEADQLADRCLAVVDQPIVIEEGVVDLSATVGVAALEPDDTVDAVLARAEMAARAARAGGNHTAARYVPELGEAAVRRDRLRADLPGAQARGELSVVLQPIVSLGEQRVAGLEGRLRWRHSELGDITAAEFLPVAERTGLVADLHRWGMEEAMRVTASMPTSGAPLRLGIDVPTGWAAGGTLLPDVEAALSRTGFEPERLVLELTEDTVLAGDERVRMDLRTLRLMGAHIALDDFGAGEASLASLTVLPIDILKLDRSFLARVDRDPQSRALYESVVGIGRALGLDVVAEGVETPAQLAAAHTFGVGFAQGFLIGRPMPPDDLACSLAAGAGELWPGLVESR